MLDDNGTRALTNIQFCQYQMLEGVLTVVIVTLYVCILHSIIHTIGSQLMRSLFAYVDKTENFTFTFLPGISDSDIYPGT